MSDISQTTEQDGVAVTQKLRDNGDGTYSPYVALNPGSGSIANANVTRTTAGGAAAGQTLKLYAGSQSLTGGGTITLETVATGKTFYITDIHFTTDNTSTTVINVQAGGVTIFPSCISTTAGCDMAGLETQPSATTGQSVTVLYPSVSGKTLYYFISGYEQ